MTSGALSAKATTTATTTATTANLNSPSMDIGIGRNTGPSSGRRRLEIGIIGAGIAGLGAAIALGRAGHGIEIFERSHFSNEIGAAIHVCPNATRVLRPFGFDFQQARADGFGSGTVMRGDTMERTYYGSYENWEKKYGVPGYFLHRVDLHDGLRDLVLKTGMGARGAARIKLGAEVVDLDCEAGRIELVDGRVFTKDVVVIADGVHSRFVHKIAGDISPARRTGQSIFRFLISTEKLRANPVTAPLFPESEPSGVRIAVLGNRRMVWYPCRNGTVQNCALIHADERYSENVEDYHAKASKDELLMTYKAFHPALVEMCNQAEDIKLWPLLYRRPNPTWTKGRAVLIGDAAHPMLPHQGQGGAQGLEDGAALGVMLSQIPKVGTAPTSGSDSARSSISDDSDVSLGRTDLDAVIAERLHLFQEIRKNRTAAVQIFSNAGQDEAKNIMRDARPYVNGKVPTNQQEFHDYSYGYDVVDDCLQALKRLQDRGSEATDLKEDLGLEVGRCNL